MPGETEFNRRLPSCSLTAAIIAPLLLSACASAMKMPEHLLPEPIIDPLRLSAGLYYVEALLDVEYAEKNTALTYTP